MKISIPQILYDQLIDYCRQQFPLKACGLLAGKQSDGVKHILKIYYVENRDKSRRYFTIDPKEQIQAVMDMNQKGLSPLGTFHSHPDKPAELSEGDLKMSMDKRASYVIVSLAERLPTLRSFQVSMSDGKAVAAEEEVEIKPL
ncbi:MAG: M67 family metallopeptidase [Deltaproteobacteria bacterium]|jgi:proteasome lid subunit RPN8/RPN11|nr:M67 family metallopeptidase [Deltaproteobacteria bacterium]